MDLKFSNPTFHEGMNLTVRRGVQWAALGSKLANLPDYGNRTAFIHSIQVFSFNLLLDSDLVLEHDEKCRTVEGLLAEMQRIYPDFSPRETVTLLFFKII